jgi:hypothetical protein
VVYKIAVWLVIVTYVAYGLGFSLGVLARADDKGKSEGTDLLFVPLLIVLGPPISAFLQAGNFSYGDKSPTTDVPETSKE